nr:hypothetical protein [Rhizobium leguminosarum]
MLPPFEADRLDKMLSDHGRVAKVDPGHGDAMKEAQALLLGKLDSVTLDKIAADFEAKLTALPATSIPAPRERR